MYILFRLLVLLASFVVFISFSFVMLAAFHTMSYSASLFIWSYIIMWISYLYGTLDLIGDKFENWRESKVKT